ncbi:MAG: cupin domain-containing protein [Candidatus Acidiferrales bacterium]
MERRAILQSLIAGLAIGSLKTVCDADDKDTKGLLVTLGENRNRAGYSIANFLISGKDTGGALAIIGTHSAPPDQCLVTPSRLGLGIPLHIHYAQDEYFYFIRGEHLVQVGDKKFYGKPGDLVFGPRGVPHSPRALSANSLGLTMWQPAGTMEEFFHELDEVERKAGGKRPTPAAFAALFKAHGMEIVGPPVEP